MTWWLLRADTFRLLWIIFCFRNPYLYPPETECVDCELRRLIRVYTLRRVHTVGFLVERLICMRTDGIGFLKTFLTIASVHFTRVSICFALIIYKYEISIRYLILYHVDTCLSFWSHIINLYLLQLRRLHLHYNKTRQKHSLIQLHEQIKKRKKTKQTEKRRGRRK